MGEVIKFPEQEIMPGLLSKITGIIIGEPAELVERKKRIEPIRFREFQKDKYGNLLLNGRKIDYELYCKPRSIDYIACGKKDFAKTVRMDMTHAWFTEKGFSDKANSFYILEKEDEKNISKEEISVLIRYQPVKFLGYQEE